jgi:hypothetical protein
MYRKRRKMVRRRRRATAVAAFAAILATAVSVPTLASADQVNDLLNNLGLGNGAAGGGAGSSGGGSTSAPSDTRAGVPPTYTPPLHGTSPHGQGTNAVVDLSPGSSNPYSGDPTQSGEEVVVGDSTGTQDASGYHGSTTLAYLFGQPILQVTSNPGESNTGPFQPVQDVLDQVCDASGDQVCLTLLAQHSSSTSNSSTNGHEVLGVHLGGQNGINADVLTSNGNISDDGSCQTAHGDSNVATASIGGTPVVDALQGSSDSTACSSGTQSVSQDSTVLKLLGFGLPIPAAGCDNGTANSNFTPLSPLLAAVCNANDTDGSQTAAPYGVREALTLAALISGDSPLLKVAASGPETHAQAPTDQNPPPPPTPPDGGGTQGAGGQGGNQGGGPGGGAADGGAGDGGAGAVASAAAAGDGQLAFTGANLLVLGLVGGALILGGLALTKAGRRHRQTV